MSRMVKKCPWVVPFYPARKAVSTESRSGERRDETKRRCNKDRLGGERKKRTKRNRSADCLLDASPFFVLVRPGSIRNPAPQIHRPLPPLHLHPSRIYLRPLDPHDRHPHPLPLHPRRFLTPPLLLSYLPHHLRSTSPTPLPSSLSPLYPRPPSPSLHASSSVVVARRDLTSAARGDGDRPRSGGRGAGRGGRKVWEGVWEAVGEGDEGAGAESRRGRREGRGGEYWREGEVEAGVGEVGEGGGLGGYGGVGGGAVIFLLARIPMSFVFE